MAKMNPFQHIRLTKELLWLIAILLAFVLLLIFIWLWYDIALTSLDKAQHNSSSIY